MGVKASDYIWYGCSLLESRVMEGEGMVVKVKALVITYGMEGVDVFASGGEKREKVIVMTDGMEMMREGKAVTEKVLVITDMV